MNKEEIIEDIKYNHLEDILQHSEVSVHAKDPVQHTHDQRERIDKMFNALRTALTEAHQAGIEEAVEIVEQEKSKLPYGYVMTETCADEKVGAYIQALDDVKKTLHEPRIEK